jgi:hydroxymethylpyrimidine/phosphomethylpyrimidine kinase
VLGDLKVAAIKTGMLANAEIVRAVAARLPAMRGRALVVDPVMVASSGRPLLDAGGIEALKHGLVPAATLLTPNLAEAARLLDARAAANEAEMVAQAKALKALGCAAVLLKGGHSGASTASDVFYDGRDVTLLTLPRIATDNTHGTGCVLSAAVTALLAHGVVLGEAVGRAKTFVWEALSAAGTRGLGHGSGPIDILHAARGRPLPA